MQICPSNTKEHPKNTNFNHWIQNGPIVLSLLFTNLKSHDLTTFYQDVENTDWTWTCWFSLSLVFCNIHAQSLQGIPFAAKLTALLRKWSCHTNTFFTLRFLIRYIYIFFSTRFACLFAILRKEVATTSRTAWFLSPAASIRVPTITEKHQEKQCLITCVCVCVCVCVCAYAHFIPTYF